MCGDGCRSWPRSRTGTCTTPGTIPGVRPRGTRRRWSTTPRSGRSPFAATGSCAGAEPAQVAPGPPAGAGTCGAALALGSIECQVTMLDERKAAILRAVVEEYIDTAQPVGSAH